MAVKKEQIEKWNAAMGQGFVTDVWHYLVHKEKCPHVSIPLSDGKYIKVQLMYQEEYEKRTNDYGCSWNVPTGRYIPTAHVSKWISGEKVDRSYGMGHWVPVGEPQNKKLFSVLQKLTKTVDINELAGYALHDATCVEDSKPIF